MFLKTPSAFIQKYVEELDLSLFQINPQFRLSNTQKDWISFCLMGIILTNTLCWAKFKRISLGKYSISALSWMFRSSKILWESLLEASVSLILKKYHISQGTLVIDDTDKKRSKVTKNIFQTYKVYDKSTAGFFNGQTVVFLLFVTDKITIPVGFRFYKPSPEYSTWFKQEKKLKKEGIARKLRPQKPAPNPNYPTKMALGISLLKEFKSTYSGIKVKLVLADNLYGIQEFVDEAENLFKTQVISQVRANQKIRHRGKELAIKDYFKREGIDSVVKVRGGKSVSIKYDSARLFLNSHGKKRFIVALKYEGEEEYRYLSASNLSWRGMDILRGFTLRWLVEVFFEDFKQYEGWGQGTKQTGIEGSSRCLTLSLLLDHCLLFHPNQEACLKDKLPIATVGSLRERIAVEHLLENVRELALKSNVNENIEQLALSIKELFPLRESAKHMVGRELGKAEPTPSLKNRARVVSTYV